jgi:hypothetical protein
MPITALSFATLMSMQPPVRAPKSLWGEVHAAFHDVWRAAWAPNISIRILHGSTTYVA